MKFALHLRENLVPEWRDQYVDYKLGKKKLKRLTKKQLAKTPRLRTRDPTVVNQSVTVDTTTGIRQGEDENQQDGENNNNNNTAVRPADVLNVDVSTGSDHYGTISQEDQIVQLPPPAIVQSSDTKRSGAQDGQSNPKLTDKSPLLHPSSTSVKSFVSRLNKSQNQSPAGIKLTDSYNLDFNNSNNTNSPSSKQQQQQQQGYEDFLDWLDSELEKIEAFYVLREQEAVDMYLVLQDQLLRMQEHRKRSKARSAKHDGTINKAAKSTHNILARKFDLPSLPLCMHKNTSKLMEHSEHGHIDYERRDDQMVTYTIAKRQLKSSMKEYYRSLELLHGYRALNHTGFRKMIKKFDKTTNSDESAKFMEKVDQKEFVKSDVLDNLMNKTENMYAQFFEKGRHKSAVEKLRAKEFPAEHYGAMFVTGIFLGFGIPLFIQALVVGLSHLDNPDRPDVYFLFQVWGGFFVVNLMLVLFTVNLLAWDYYKINYPFIFEFDQRTFLDHRQFGVLPAILFFLMALFGYLTFEDFWPDQLPAKYFPIIYLGIAVLIFLFPAPYFYWRARKWLFIALWRLFLSGLYPVEFRDFFMGDILCSLCYSLSNASFIFCLYATHWVNVYPGSPHTSKCSSSESRLLGFLNCLPGIWRFLQCIRRYGDTYDWFPHLANAAKYSCLILYYMLLSLLRISKGTDTVTRVWFIIFAAINAVYSSFWDILMDWSLGQWDSKNFLLRDELAFPKWFYYAMIIVDPILRMSWILYAAFASEIQQSAKISFFVALIEIVRRFLWIFLRVENEHCTNVGRFRASRDLHLPYIPASKSYSKRATAAGVAPGDEHAIIDDEEQQLPTPLRRSITLPESLRSEGGEDMTARRGSLRRRGTIAQMATPVIRAMSTAHSRDFERRRPSAADEDKDAADDDNPMNSN